MRFITVSGPPSSGKTSVICQMIRSLSMEAFSCVIKFDCEASGDAEIYEKKGIEFRRGLSEDLCPDHYYASNIHSCVCWSLSKGYDLLIAESAGLCNRCAPHIQGVPAICVIDCLSGFDTPRKIGPMLRLADVIVLTKGDIASPAEREVFSYRVRQLNSKAVICSINGLTGEGIGALTKFVMKSGDYKPEEALRLRTNLPRAVCSYCFGQTGIGRSYQRGETRKINIIPELPAEI